MGATISQLWTPRSISVSLVGLPSAGKTAIRFKLSGIEGPVPKSTETLEISAVFQGTQQYDLLEFSGDVRYRPIWRSYLTRYCMIVFVVDSTDREAMSETKDELLRVVREDMYAPKPVLILAHKQDDPKAISVAELIGFFGIQEDLKQTSRYHILGSSAVTREGLAEGLEWGRKVVRALEAAL